MPTMIDTHEVVREYLITQSGVTDVVGTGANAQIWYPRVGKNVTYPAISYRFISGDTEDATPVSRVNVDFICHGLDSDDEAGKGQIIDLGRALHDALWNRTMITTTSGLIYAIAETEPGQIAIDPDANRWAWLAAYEFHFKLGT